MSRILIITILWATLVTSAFGLSEEIPVTPKSLDQGEYAFSVVTKTVTNGLAFRVVISKKTDDISTSCSIGISVITHWEPGGSGMLPVKPAIPVTVKKDGRIWSADFIASSALLQTAGASFVFTEPVCFGTAAFYEIKLRDFAPEIHVPTRLNVERTSNRISVTVDNRNYLECTNIVVPSEAGQAFELYVYPVGQSRPLKPPLVWGYSGGTDFNLGTHYLYTRKDGVPVPGKSYVVDVDLALFEAPGTNFIVGDIPPISEMPTEKSCHILWRGRLEQIVK